MRKKKLMSIDVSQDQPITDAHDSFRVYFFNFLIDTDIALLKQRFDHMKTQLKNFAFFFTTSLKKMGFEIIALNW